MNGGRLCDGDAECARPIDEAQIRVVVTSPEEGDIDFDILIGPDRDNPVSGSVHDDLLAAELDLGGVKGAAEHLANLSGEDFGDFPTTFEGRLRAELRVDSADQVAIALSVLNAIDVAGGGYTFSLAPSSPAIELIANGTTETLGLLVDIGALDATAPYVVNDFGDDGGGVSTEYAAKVHLGGLSATSLLSGDLIAVQNIGLGDDTSTIELDGQQVLAVDLNKDDGRRMTAVFELQSDDNLKVVLDPVLDLLVKTNFVGMDAIDVDPTLIKETLRVLVDGDDAPSMMLGEDGMKMLTGAMTITTEEANVTLAVAEGQCLLPVEEDALSAGDLHPLEELQPGACQ